MVDTGTPIPDRPERSAESVHSVHSVQSVQPVRRPAASQRGIAALGLCCLLGLAGPAAGQKATTQSLDSSPMAWETETAQAGGTGVGRYAFVGALRCAQPGQGLVGMRLMRSAVVDALQIGCAPVQCDDDGDCRWDKLDRGMAAGQANARSTASIAVCAHDEVVSGYRARTRVLERQGRFDYVADLQLQCARVIGPALPVGDPGHRDAASRAAGLPISTEQRHWLAFPADRGHRSASPPPPGSTPDAPRDTGTSADAATSDPSTSADADDAWPITQQCAGRAASALSVGVGRYLPTGGAAIQALSMFCVRAPDSSGLGTRP